MYENTWAKLEYFSIKSLGNCNVMIKNMIVITNFEKKRPSLSILAILDVAITKINTITRLNINKDRVIRYTTDAEIQSNSSVRLTQLIP